jgi:hypothetical protein
MDRLDWNLLNLDYIIWLAWGSEDLVDAIDDNCY